MSHGDELLSWHTCGRCQHVFLPPPDRLVICPACRAANAVPFTGDPRFPFVVVRDWLAHYGWPALHAASGGIRPAYFLESLCLWPSRASAHLVDGAPVLWDQGTGASIDARPDIFADRRREPDRYGSIRIAAFFAARPSPEQRATAERVWAPFAMLGRPQISERGVQLVCFPHVGELWQQREGATRALAAFVRALGAGPVHPLMPSRTGGRLPDPSTAERTVRCGHCGAPVRADALTLEASACPFCYAHIHIPPELHAEIAHYARTLRAQDPRWTFNATQFWQMWQQRPADVVACAVCGAPSSRGLGIVNARCGHCRALIVPSAARLQADVGVVRGAFRQVEHAHARTLWSNAAGGQAMDDALGRWLPTVFIGGGVPLGVAALTFVLLVVGPLEDLAREAQIVVACGACVMGLLLAWVGIRFRRHRRARSAARWSEAFDRVGEQLECAHGPGRTAAQVWCSRWWPHAIAPLVMISEGHQVFQLDLGGLPAMVEVDAVGARALRVLVAAHWEPSAGALKEAPGVVARRRALWDAGFAIRLRRAGLEMNASAGLVARLREDPSAIGILVPVLYEVRRIMGLLDARAPG